MFSNRPVEKIKITATLLETGEHDEGDVRNIGRKRYRFEISANNGISLARRIRASQEVENALLQGSIEGIHPLRVSVEYRTHDLPDQVLIDPPRAYATEDDQDRLLKEHAYDSFSFE